jgi:hypothetical protein
MKLRCYFKYYENVSGSPLVSAVAFVRIMYTMYTRGLLGVLVMVLMLGAAGCGGDDASTTGGAASSCDPMTQTMPVPASCPQNQPQCPSSMYTAVTTCMPNGKWNPQCSCVLTSSLQSGGQGGAGAPGGANCGNGMVEPLLNEQCDPMVTVSQTCAQMMPGTVGMVTCNPAGTPTACTLNMSMCRSATPMMPMGGAGG